MFKFDTKTTRLLDIAYQGADITRRRQASFDTLHLRPGDAILDIGCGNGFLTQELARAVGPTGKVIGVDPSDDMRKLAVDRSRDFEWVDILVGTANQLPIQNSSMNKAVSIQVFEYLDDMPGACSEAYRVLKTGGLLVVGDIHFDSLIWFSEEPGRMEKMIAAWDHHFVERRVPAVLPGLMQKTGFIIEEITPVTICDHFLRPDGLANMMMILMEQFAVDNGYFTQEEGQAWIDEQHTLAQDGRFFFSVTHFVIKAIKL